MISVISTPRYKNSIPGQATLGLMFTLMHLPNIAGFSYEFTLMSSVLTLMSGALKAVMKMEYVFITRSASCLCMHASADFFFVLDNVSDGRLRRGIISYQVRTEH